MADDAALDADDLLALEAAPPDAELAGHADARRWQPVSAGAPSIRGGRAPVAIIAAWMARPSRRLGPLLSRQVTPPKRWSWSGSWQPVGPSWPGTSMSAATNSISWRSTRVRRPTLVVVEVRWRASREFGLPEETVDHRKRTHLRMATYGLRDRGVLPDGSRRPATAGAVRPGRRRAGEPREGSRRSGTTAPRSEVGSHPESVGRPRPRQTASNHEERGWRRP